MRFHFVNDIREVKPVYKEPDKSFWNQAFDENEPDALMPSLMNKVTKIESNLNEDTINLFKHAQNGGGLVCSGMADIFADILASKKYTVRRVNLYRALADQYSSHSVTEILLNGHWVIYDPTFNITFKKNGQLIGAQDIHRALLDGSFNEIETEFHGPVAYPARIDKYYMHYLSLYNNVLIFEPAKLNWYGLPPFRYWLGPKYYVQAEQELGQQNTHMIFFNELNFIFVALIPIVLICCFSLGIFILMLTVFNTRQKGTH